MDQICLTTGVEGREILARVCEEVGASNKDYLGSALLYPESAKTESEEARTRDPDDESTSSDLQMLKGTGKAQEACTFCTDRMDYFAVYKCCRPYCWLCAIRLKRQAFLRRQDFHCPFCRETVKSTLLTSKEVKWNAVDFSKLPAFPPLDLYFQDAVVETALNVIIRDFVCWLGDCSPLRAMEPDGLADRRASLLDRADRTSHWPRKIPKARSIMDALTEEKGEFSSQPSKELPIDAARIGAMAASALSMNSNVNADMLPVGTSNSVSVSAPASSDHRVSSESLTDDIALGLMTEFRDHVKAVHGISLCGICWKRKYQNLFSFENRFYTNLDVHNVSGGDSNSKLVVFGEEEVESAQNTGDRETAARDQPNEERRPNKTEGKGEAARSVDLRGRGRKDESQSRGVNSSHSSSAIAHSSIVPDTVSNGHVLCKICGAWVYDREDYSIHWRSSDNHFDCKICGEYCLYSTLDALLRHYDSNHYLCKFEECKNLMIVFNCLKDLQIHQAKKHSHNSSLFTNCGKKGLMLHYWNQEQESTRTNRRRADASTSSTAQTRHSTEHLTDAHGTWEDLPEDWFTNPILSKWPIEMIAESDVLFEHISDAEMISYNVVEVATAYYKSVCESKLTRQEYQEIDAAAKKFRKAREDCREALVGSIVSAIYRPYCRLRLERQRNAETFEKDIRKEPYTLALRIPSEAWHNSLQGQFLKNLSSASELLAALYWQVPETLRPCQEAFRGAIQKVSQFAPAARNHLLQANSSQVALLSTPQASFARPTNSVGQSRSPVLSNCISLPIQPQVLFLEALENAISYYLASPDRWPLENDMEGPAKVPQLILNRMRATYSRTDLVHLTHLVDDLGTFVSAKALEQILALRPWYHNRKNDVRRQVKGDGDKQINHEEAKSGCLLEWNLSREWGSQCENAFNGIGYNQLCLIKHYLINCQAFLPTAFGIVATAVAGSEVSDILPALGEHLLGHAPSDNLVTSRAVDTYRQGRKATPSTTSHQDFPDLAVPPGFAKGPPPTRKWGIPAARSHPPPGYVLMNSDRGQSKPVKQIPPQIPSRTSEWGQRCSHGLNPRKCARCSPSSQGRKQPAVKSNDAASEYPEFSPRLR